MARLARCEVIDPAEVSLVHVINRTVRRCFLLGDDSFTGKNFDHRKVWIEELLEQFAACFAIDLLCYAILSNHYHLILRTRPDVVAAWDDTEVARRWLLICPHRRIDGKPAEPSQAELNLIRNCPVKLAEIRRRLSDVSWWIRLLNQRVAQRANREEQEKGRFWQDRYRAIRIVDEESLLACAAYVELNPIRAAMAETLETSDHTSVQRRIQAETDRVGGDKGLPAQERRDAFLAKLTLDEQSGQVGVLPSGSGKRCSDKGFLGIDFASYLELLDWTARQSVLGKRGTTPQETPPILQRLGMGSSSWLELVDHFEQTFVLVAGRCDRVSGLRSHATGRRFRLTPRARRLLPSLG
ncbi:MAG: hypothetical protein MI861_19800 [Pirellulales bacterium]|nr:hypothetical protein [Pirellulales bacterium]